MSSVQANHNILYSLVEGTSRSLEETEIKDEYSSPPLWHTIYVGITLLSMTIILLAGKAGSEWVMVVTLTFIILSGVISVQEGLSGFGSEGALTVVALLVVASGISHAGSLEWYLTKFLGRPKKISSAQLRIMVPITFLSSFLNNTPLVVLMMPIVQKWSDHVGISQKQLLIPLTFSAVLGGTCTLIGTSTNLVVYGLLQVDFPAEAEQVSIFGITYLGVSAALIGCAYIAYFARWLLPGGWSKVGDSKTSRTCGFIVLAQVSSCSPLADKALKISNLEQVENICLLQVEKATSGEIIKSSDELVLNENDILYISGSVKHIETYCNDKLLILRSQINETSIPPDSVSEYPTNSWTPTSVCFTKIKLIQASISKSSSLIGKSLCEIDFKETYGGTVVAVQREGENFAYPFSSVYLEAKDSVLMQIEDDSGIWNKVLCFDHTKSEDTTYHEDLECGESKQMNHWRDFELTLSHETQKHSYVQKYHFSMRVMRSSSFVGKSFTASGLSRFLGTELVCIKRAGSAQTTTETSSESNDYESSNDIVCEDLIGTKIISIEEPLLADDTLWFSGSELAFCELRKVPGLTSSQAEEMENLKAKLQNRRLFQAVVEPDSKLVGQTPSSVRFLECFDAVVLAINRNGKSINTDPRFSKLSGGDLLLLEAGPTFSKFDRAFLLVSEVKNSKPPRHQMLIPALSKSLERASDIYPIFFSLITIFVLFLSKVIAVAMIALAAAGVVSLMVSAILAAFIMVLLGIISQQEARDAIDWKIYLSIASSFGISAAMQKSGLASKLADVLIGAANYLDIGPAGLYGSVYLATFLVTNVVQNNATAALLFPVGMMAAVEGGGDVVRMSYCIMLSASATFMCPSGSTTNMIIFEPGGYRSLDFLQFGAPLQIILWMFTSMMLAAPSRSEYLYLIGSAILFITSTLVAMVKLPDWLLKIFRRTLNFLKVL